MYHLDSGSFQKALFRYHWNFALCRLQLIPSQVGLVEPCFFLSVMKQLPGLVLHKPHPSKHLRVSENRVPRSSLASLLITINWTLPYFGKPIAAIHWLNHVKSCWIPSVFGWVSFFFSCLDTIFARWNVHFAWLDCHFTSQPTAFSEASQLRSSWRAACNCWVQHLVRPKGIFDGIHWRLIIFPRKKRIIYHFMGYTEFKKTRLWHCWWWLVYIGDQRRKLVMNLFSLLKIEQQFSRFFRSANRLSFDIRRWSYLREVNFHCDFGEVVLIDQIVTSHVRMLL